MFLVVGKTIKHNGHLWHQSIPSNPKSCHECNKLLLLGHDSYSSCLKSSIVICECDYCGSFIHEKCIGKSKFHCKQLTSTKSSIKHLWFSLYMWYNR